MTLDELISIVQENKRWIFCSAIGAFMLSGVFVVTQPDIYRAELLMSPADQAFGSNTDSGLGGQFGAVAAVAGISVTNSSTDPKDIAIATLSSRRFIADFLRSRNLLVPFFAGRQNLISGEVYLDRNIYDPSTDTWLLIIGNQDAAGPSVGYLHEEFTNRLNVFEDAATGTIRVSFDWIDRVQASSWLYWLIEDLNRQMKEQALREARESISFLQSAAENTAYTEMRTVYFNLLEFEMQKLMLADIREEYAFNVLDPAIIPDSRQSPNRLLIVLVVTVLATFFSILAIVYIRVNFDSKHST